MYNNTCLTDCVWDGCTLHRTVSEYPWNLLILAILKKLIIDTLCIFYCSNQNINYRDIVPKFRLENF